MIYKEREESICPSSESRKGKRKKEEEKRKLVEPEEHKHDFFYMLGKQKKTHPLPSLFLAIARQI